MRTIHPKPISALAALGLCAAMSPAVAQTDYVGTVIPKFKSYPATVLNPDGTVKEVRIRWILQGDAEKYYPAEVSIWRLVKNADGVVTSKTLLKQGLPFNEDVAVGGKTVAATTRVSRTTDPLYRTLISKMFPSIVRTDANPTFDTLGPAILPLISRTGGAGATPQEVDAKIAALTKDYYNLRRARTSADPPTSPAAQVFMLVAQYPEKAVEMGLGWTDTDTAVLKKGAKVSYAVIPHYTSDRVKQQVDRVGSEWGYSLETKLQERLNDPHFLNDKALERACVTNAIPVFTVGGDKQPGAPVYAKGFQSGANEVSLRWARTPPADTKGFGVVGYNVYRQKGAEPEFKVNATPIYIKDFLSQDPTKRIDPVIHYEDVSAVAAYTGPVKYYVRMVDMFGRTGAPATCTVTMTDLLPPPPPSSVVALYRCSDTCATDCYAQQPLEHKRIGASLATTALRKVTLKVVTSPIPVIAGRAITYDIYRRDVENPDAVPVKISMLGPSNAPSGITEADYNARLRDLANGITENNPLAPTSASQGTDVDIEIDGQPQDRYFTYTVVPKYNSNGVCGIGKTSQEVGIPQDTCVLTIDSVTPNVAGTTTQTASLTVTASDASRPVNKRAGVIEIRKLERVRPAAAADLDAEKAKSLSLVESIDAAQATLTFREDFPSSRIVRRVTYVVVPVNRWGNAGAPKILPEQLITAREKPDSPAIVSATPVETGKVKVTIQPLAAGQEATSYQLYRAEIGSRGLNAGVPASSTVASPAWAKLAVVSNADLSENALEFMDTSGVIGKIYAYKAVARRNANDTDNSDIASAYPAYGAPMKPTITAPAISAMNATSRVLTWTWADTVKTGGCFVVLRGPLGATADSDFTQISGVLPATTLAFTDGAALANTTYQYRVVAIDLEGNRATSPSVQATVK